MTDPKPHEAATESTSEITESRWISNWVL